MQYSQYEVQRAQKQLAPMLSRKLGSTFGVNEDVDHMNSDLESGYLVNKVKLNKMWV